MDLLKRENFIVFTAIELMVLVENIDFETEFRKITTWSSLNALIYISRINDETNVLISTSNLMESKTIEDIYQLVLKKYNGAS